MENNEKKSFSSGYSKGFGFGLILMLVGVVFLGFNFGLIPLKLKSVIISWQMLLIVIGVANFIKRRMISGLVLIFVGGFFIIPKVVPAVNENFIHVYWPLLLIGAGVVILLQRLLGPTRFTESWTDECKNKGYHQYQTKCDSKQYTWENPSGFSKNSVFGSGDHIVLDPLFKGGELNAVFGGLSLDLRRTNLPVGETRLDLNAIFGGVIVYIPADWLVETHLDSIFGGFQDNRMPQEPLDASKKLIITGSCVFGGGELKN